MTVKLPEKAGFVPTVAEWDQLVRIAENLAAQLAQAQAERDAAREHAERQQLSKDGLYRELREMSSQRDAARAELRVLRGIAEDTEGWAALFGTASRDALLIEATIKGLRAIHAGSVEALDAARAEVARLRLALEDAYTVGDVVQMRLYIAAALRQPAPAEE